MLSISFIKSDEFDYVQNHILSTNSKINFFLLLEDSIINFFLIKLFSTTGWQQYILRYSAPFFAFLNFLNPTKEKLKFYYLTSY